VNTPTSTDILIKAYTPYAMITVTGAVIVFSTFPGASTGRSLSFASCERIKTNRAGLPLALVGPH
jgi:hypothetical protein